MNTSVYLSDNSSQWNNFRDSSLHDADSATSNTDQQAAQTSLQSDSDTTAQTVLAPFNMDADVLYFADDASIYQALASAPATSSSAPSTTPAIDPAKLAEAQRVERGMVDLLLADPLHQELIAQFSPTAITPNAADSAVMANLIDRYGQERVGQMLQLHQAQAQVRAEFVSAITNAENTKDYNQPFWDDNAQYSGWENYMPPSFNVQKFVDWYGKQDGLANRAFAEQYGTDVQTVQVYQGGDSGDYRSYYTLAGGAIKLTPETYSIGESSESKRAYTLETPGLYVFSDPGHPPKLFDSTAVAFDGALGFITTDANLVPEKDWLGDLLPVIFVAVFTGGLGAAGLLPTAATFGGGVTGAVIAGAVQGSVAGLISGGVNGNLSLRGVFQSALSGGLLAGVGELGAIKDLNNLGLDASGNVTSYALRAVSITGNASIRGAIAELTGGKFKDSFTQAMAAGLSGEVTRAMEGNIRDRLGRGEIDADAARGMMQLTRITGSAIRAAANPNDPLHAFASDFLQQLASDISQEIINRPKPEDLPALDMPDADLELMDSEYELPDDFDFGDDIDIDDGGDNVDNIPDGGTATRPQRQARVDTFTEQYLLESAAVQVAGAGDSRLASAMTALQGSYDSQGRWSITVSPEQIEQSLRTIAEVRNVPIDNIRQDFATFNALASERNNMSQIKPITDGQRYNETSDNEYRVPMLSLSEGNGVPNNSAHMGSLAQLRFGRFIGDTFGIDPVFGALLSPTGGIAGAGNREVSNTAYAMGGGREVVTLHGIAHDAGGYLRNYHGMGPGYQYVPSSFRLLDRTNPIAGQVQGLYFFRNVTIYGTPNPPPREPGG
jgi:hypothetical protein